MGRCPTGTVPGGFQRGGRKRGLQTDLQNEIVQEIETLLGRQSIADLDLEAIEMAARRQTLRLAAHQSIIRGGHTFLTIRTGPETVTNMGDRLDLLIPLNQDAIGRHLGLLSAGAPCVYNADTIEPGVAAEGVGLCRFRSPSWLTSAGTRWPKTRLLALVSSWSVGGG